MENMSVKYLQTFFLLLYIIIKLEKLKSVLPVTEVMS